MRHRETSDGAEFVKVYEADAAEAFEAINKLRKTNSADTYLIADYYKNGSFGDFIGIKFQLKSQFDPNETLQIGSDQLAALKGLSLVKGLRDAYVDSIAHNLHYMHTVVANPDLLLGLEQPDIGDDLFEMTDIIYQEYTHTLNESSSVGLTITSAKTKTGSTVLLAETVDAAGKSVAIVFEDNEFVYLNHQYKSEIPQELEEFTQALIESDLPVDIVQSMAAFMAENTNFDPTDLTEHIAQQTQGKVDIAIIDALVNAIAQKLESIREAALFTEEIGEIESSYEEIRQVKLVATLLGIIRSGSEE